ncbi:MAG: cytochrome c oxidase assembly protein [Solirubrobacterales bacterium]|nr:cytochrome c oxidase assembly protein [Solirubrobacterales bacterium]
MIPFPTIPLALSDNAVAMLELIPLTVAVVFYWHRVMTLSWAGRPVPVWRQVSYGFGLFLASFVLFSPWGYLAEELVIAHMVEHLVIGDLASLFIVLGLTRSIMQPILALPYIGRLQVLANPFIAIPLWAINLFFWHIPTMYDAAYGGAIVHGLEHSLFLFFGCLMWMPVFGPLPTPKWFGPGWKVVYVVIVRFIAAILGNILMWTQVELYKNYGAGHAKWGISAIQDQSTAGVIMMVEGTFLILGVLAWTFFEAAKQSTQKQDLIDLAYNRGVEIDEARIERAVKAGHGDLIEQRILAGDEGAEAPALAGDAGADAATR